MGIPSTIKNVLAAQIRANLEDPEKFFTLKRRKGLSSNTYQICNDKESLKVISAWNKFHEGIRYTSFRQVANKWSLCQDLTREYFIGDAKEQFIQLISDRFFLFLEYNESLVNADSKLPLLSDLVMMPSLDVDGYTQEAFEPTREHRDAWRGLEKNRREIDEALEMRKKHKSIELFPPGLREPFSLTGGKRCQFQNEEEREKANERIWYVSNLFWEYLFTLAYEAYVNKYTVYFEDFPDDLGEIQVWDYKKALSTAPKIEAVYSQLIERKIPPEYWPVVFFILLSQKTKKLADGKLEVFQFKEIQRRSNKPPAEAQQLEVRKNEINTMLYDYLREIFLPENETDDKDVLYRADLLFYLVTGYNGYSHYKVLYKDRGFGFDLTPIPQRGVDQLASIIRFNIIYCIPNLPSWLVPDLPEISGESNGGERTQNALETLDALSMMLLRDGALPVITRLMDRVRRFLDSEDGKDLVEEYKECTKSLDDSEIADMLKTACYDNNLLFYGEDTFYDSQRERGRDRVLCSRLVLEYGIIERFLSEAQDNLSQIATELFGDLLFKGESFNIPRRNRGSST